MADLRVLVRRWYASGLGLALTIGLCLAALSGVHPTYEVKADVLFLPPKDIVRSGGNPYLALGDLNAFADVAARTISSQQSAQQLLQAGATGTYTVALDNTAAGPVVLVTVDAASPAVALNTLGVVLNQFPRTISQVQVANGIGPAAQITSTVITRDDQASASRKSQLRALIVALAGGLVLTFFGTSLLDSFLVRRRTRRTGGQNGVAGSGQQLAPAAAPPQLPQLPHLAQPVAPAQLPQPYAPAQLRQPYAPAHLTGGPAAAQPSPVPLGPVAPGRPEPLPAEAARSGPAHSGPDEVAARMPGRGNDPVGWLVEGVRPVTQQEQGWPLAAPRSRHSSESAPGGAGHAEQRAEQRVDRGPNGSSGVETPSWLSLPVPVLKKPNGTPQHTGGTRYDRDPAS